MTGALLPFRRNFFLEWASMYGMVVAQSGFESKRARKKTKKKKRRREEERR